MSNSTPGHAEFVHLHNHTEYSLLDGACRLVDDKGKPGDLLNTIAHNFKMPALAITDHGNMYGAIEFYKVCHDVGIKPIIGTEMYMAPNSCLDKKLVPGVENYYHLTMLARDNEGYKNLMKLSTAGFLEGFYYKPRIDKDLLAKHSKGIIGMSGCLIGEVANLVLNGKIKEAEKVASDYRDIFGAGNFFIELMDNGLPEQKQVLPGLMEIAKRTGIPLVATNDCHYLRKEDAFDHDVLLCIGTGKNLDDPKRLKFSSDQFYYRSPQEMIQLFSYVPEAIKNTLVIADKCAVDIKFDQILLPHYPVPEGETDDSYLLKLCREGIQRRYKSISEVHEKRLAHELDIIGKMGFASYFLIVWDFIHYSKQHGIPVGPGRGSGAGSMVAYVLGITDICPLHYNLLFERFLNPERRSMPDLDIDFADTGRQSIIEYVRNKYGHANCAQIITFGSMQARLVIKDVARAMGFLPSESDKISKMVPFGSNIYTAEQTVPELKNAMRTDPRVAKMIATARKLEGLKRHTGVHAAGMIIAKEEITNYCPLAKGSRDVVTTQYHDEPVLKLGLLKVDFLGLRTLTIIDDAEKLIKAGACPDFNWDNIPLDDPKTFQLFAEARTLGVFQLESRGMRDLLHKLKATTLEDIIALNALYRPGPMGSGMIDDFVSRKHGLTKVKYDHPIMEPILKDTYGVILYQEQVMRLARDMSGFSMGEADGLRKAMGKKIPEEIEKQRGKFIEGAKKNNIDKKLAEKVFDNIVHFGGYGFNKSHAAAYGMVAYRTAYLKANYPQAFMTALLNSEIGRSAVANEEDNKLVGYLQDTEAMKIKILPPDIQTSPTRFTPENGNIRFGLMAVKNVGEGAVESIIASRSEKGPFKSWNDFINRVDLHAANRKVLESLIKAGAFDSLGAEGADMHFTRADLTSKLDMSLEIAASSKQDESAGQGQLFDSGEFMKEIASPLKVEPWPDHTALAFEKEVLGFYLSGHPLAQHMQDIVSFAQYRLDRLPPGSQDFKNAPMVRLAGMLVNPKRMVSKEKKEQYARFKLEDMYGEIEAVVFPRGYPGLAKYIVPNNFVVIKGKLSARDSNTELIVEDIKLLAEAKQLFTPYLREVHIKVSSAGLEDGLLDQLKNVIGKFPGTSPVLLDVLTPPSGEYVVETGLKIAAEQNFFLELEKMLGPESWELLSCTRQAS